MLRSKSHAWGFTGSVGAGGFAESGAGDGPFNGTRRRIWGAIVGQCVALSNSTMKRRKTRFAGLGWVRGRGEARVQGTVKRGIARGIGSMATQGFSTRSACAVVPLHAPRAGSSLARGCTPGRTALTNIGRRAGGIFILPGGRSRGPRREFLSGLAPGAPWRAGGSRSPGARPSFARPAVSPRAGLAEPGHAAPARGGRVLNLASRQLPPRTAQGATLGQGGIPMSQIAPAVGTAPARRLRRLAADGCGSEQFIPGALLESCDGTPDRAAHRGRGARPARGDHHAHPPATAATATSCSALASSNHSDMAAH